MPLLLLFLKAYVPEHTRRTKAGKIITVKAYYDKRIKKAAIHAPDHNHDVSHLSDEDKVKFANLHKEQHVSHYYEAHALKRKLEAEHQLRNTLKHNLERYKTSGDTKSWTSTQRKLEALERRMVIHQKQLSRAEKIAKGIGEMKDGLVKDSGTLTDDADQAHAHYVGKLGERFKDTTYQTGRLLPASAAPSYFKTVILNSKEGEIIPNPKFNLGKLSEKATQELSLIIDGSGIEQRNIRLSGRTIKHIAEQRPKLAEHIVNNLVKFFAENPEVYPNHQHQNRALLVHLGDDASGDKHYAAAVEVIIKGEWIDIISMMSMPERTLKKARQLKQEIMDGQQPQNSDSHHHVASRDTHAEADFTDVHDSLDLSIAQPAENTSQKDGDQKETWQMTLDEFKNKNPELSGNRAKSRWAGEVHDAWNAGHAVPEKTLSELKEIRPTFIPDGLADNDTLLERLGSKITAHIENEISKKQLEHQKELTVFKRKETLDRKKGIDFKESHEKHGGNLVSLTKEIESLKDELHERKYTEKTNGKHALRIVQQYRDVQLKKHNELKAQQKRPAR